MHTPGRAERISTSLLLLDGRYAGRFRLEVEALAAGTFEFSASKGQSACNSQNGHFFIVTHQPGGFSGSENALR